MNLDSWIGKMVPVCHLCKVLVGFLARRSHSSCDCYATSAREEEQGFDFPWMAGDLSHHYEILLLYSARSMMKMRHCELLGPHSKDALCGIVGCYDQTENERVVELDFYSQPEVMAQVTVLQGIG